MTSLILQTLKVLHHIKASNKRFNESDVYILTHMMKKTVCKVYVTASVPAEMARERASTLSPILRTVSGDGPMNMTPASAQAWAKSERSERKP